MKKLALQSHPNLIVGIETADDAGVYRISPETALIQTVDFFTPIVDDPRDFGRIAAANSLSDVYAMGGVPITALNLVCFPSGDLPETVLFEILAGGLEKIREAGAVLVGGHSVDDRELKYGLSVTGIVHPDRIITNSSAQAGDALILTKPLGLGVLATAIKGGLADPRTTALVTETAAMLNKKAAETMAAFAIHSCTDITGFGLCGHSCEMAAASGKTLVIEAGNVPLLEKAMEFARMGVLPGGCHANRKHFNKQVSVAPSVDPVLADILFDPQTSGGLLISVDQSDADRCLSAMRAAGIPAANIGKVSDKNSDFLVSVL